MHIAIVENGSVVQIGDYRELFPNVSFPSSGPGADFMTDNNCLPVTLWKSYDSNTQKLTATSPYVEDGHVFTVVVEELSPEDILARAESQWANVRSQRNKLLAECDWTQLADNPLTNVQQAEWATYRQALRDVTSQEDPFNITWPSDPNTLVQPEQGGL